MLAGHARGRAEHLDRARTTYGGRDGGARRRGRRARGKRSTEGARVRAETGPGGWRGRAGVEDDGGAAETSSMAVAAAMIDV